jgi:glycosyltransferase involved in cell wall biosynthesis
MYGYKGVDTAIDAFARVRKVRPEAELVVAGRGPIAEELAGHPPPGIVVLNYYQSESELERLFARTTLVLLPYRDATQSGVGLQAIARGIPCIVSRAGALPELIEPVAPGCVVPCGDPEALAEAILRYLDHELSLRQAVQQHARGSFGWPVVARMLMSELHRTRVLKSETITRSASNGPGVA